MPENCESLFHYTDINAVASILKYKKLWLTNIGYLNDSKEFHEGMSIFSKIVRGFKVDKKFAEKSDYIRGMLDGIINVHKVLPDVNLYTCSFSKAPDLLSQWRAYGNFAIEFSRKKIELKHSIHDCRYTLEEKEEVCRRGIDNLISHRFSLDGRSEEFDVDPLRKFMVDISTLKSTHFQAESEVRMIVGSDYEMTGVNFRGRGDYLVPYLEREFDPDSVKAVHIGPIADQDIAERSLLSLLRSCGLNNVSIKRSDIPFRS